MPPKKSLKASADGTEPPSKPVRARKVKKTPSFVLSDNEDPPATPSPVKKTATALNKPSAISTPTVKPTAKGASNKVKKEPIPAVTMSPTKLKPSFSKVVPIEISDTESALTEEDESELDSAATKTADKVLPAEDELGEEEGEGDYCDSDETRSISEAADSDDSFIELDKDDNMFQGSPPPPPALRIQKRQLSPVVPPLLTRAAAGDSPLKGKGKGGKAKLAKASEEEVDRAESPTKKARLTKDKSSARPKPIPIKSQGKSFPKSEPPTQDLSVLTDDEEATDVKKPTPVDLNSITTFHSDNNLIFVSSLPDVCQVSEPNNQDNYLVQRGYYANLPNLRSYKFEPLKDSQNHGLVCFSGWPKVLKSNFNKKMALAALSFVQDDDYVNLARIDPRLLCAAPSAAVKNSFDIKIKANPSLTALCFSPVMVMESHLQSFNPNLNHMGYHLVAKFHSEELNRQMAVISMVTQNPIISAQYWNDNMTFTTKTLGSFSANKAGSGNEPSSSSIRGALMPPTSSPVKSARPTTVAGNGFSPLEFGADIPVYDARGETFDFDKDTLRNIPRTLPRFYQELSKGSLAVVAYMTQINNAKPPRYYHYVQWVILFAEPLEKIDRIE